MLEWKPFEAGIFRLNRVHEDKHLHIHSDREQNAAMQGTFAHHDENPREFRLKSINAMLCVDTRIEDLYSSPHDQVAEQLRVLIERMKEQQEEDLLYHSDYGLLNNVTASQRISTRTGPPTPDDLDELLTKVWKEPSFFLAHPRAIAAFGRECTRRGVPPPTITLFGSPFHTWRGVPLVPCDKFDLPDGSTKTSILLIRSGEKKQGVIGLFQTGLSGEQSPSLSVRLNGINEKGQFVYLISLNTSAVVLTDDALASLNNVEIGNYHEYK